MKLLKRLLIAFALLLLIAGALPFFISLDDYIPQIEKAASARLKQPVSIKRIRFSALPLPHVTVDGISIDTGADVSIGKVVLTPDLFSLLRPTKVIKRIDIDSLVLTRKAIEKIPAWVGSGAANSPQQAPQVRVESINLKNALVNFGKTRLGPFDAHVELDAKGDPEDASISTQDGRLKLRIKPKDSNYLIDASAKSWTLPAGPALVFDELIIKGVATPNDAKLSEVSARLYGGTAAGRVTVNWQKGLRLDGNFDISKLELRQLAPLLSPGTHVSGKLNAKPVFSGVAASADQLADALRLETPFNVQNGALGGVDIQKAATNLIKQGTNGGKRVRSVVWTCVMEHGSYRFTQLKIASGALAADGDVNISRTKELSGRINAQVKVVGAGANVPLNVGGTLASPLLYPLPALSRAQPAGTAILGPGLGTCGGCEKSGGWVEGLFGKKGAEEAEKIAPGENAQAFDRIAPSMISDLIARAPGWLAGFADDATRTVVQAHGDLVTPGGLTLFSTSLPVTAPPTTPTTVMTSLPRPAPTWLPSRPPRTPPPTAPRPLPRPLASISRTDSITPHSAQVSGAAAARSGTQDRTMHFRGGGLHCVRCLLFHCRLVAGATHRVRDPAHHGGNAYGAEHRQCDARDPDDGLRKFAGLRLNFLGLRFHAGDSLS